MASYGCMSCTLKDCVVWRSLGMRYWKMLSAQVQTFAQLHCIGSVAIDSSALTAHRSCPCHSQAKCSLIASAPARCNPATSLGSPWRPCPIQAVQLQAQLSRPEPTLLVWRIRPVLLCRVRANKMLGLSLWIWSFQSSTKCLLLRLSGFGAGICVPQAPSMPPMAIHQACYHPFFVLSAPET